MAALKNGMSLAAWLATGTMARGGRRRALASLCGLVCAGLLAGTGASAQAPGQSTITIAVQTAGVNEGENAVFTLTRSRPVGQSRKVRVSISGHDKIMSAATGAIADDDDDGPSQRGRRGNERVSALGYG